MSIEYLKELQDEQSLLVGHVIKAKPNNSEEYYIRLQFYYGDQKSYKWNAELSEWNSGVSDSGVLDDRWRVE